MTLQEAEKLFAEPKSRRGGGAAAAPPLRELGTDPANGKPLVVKDGRFGPYVTDGETNATLPRGTSVEQLTLDRAAELMADKRAKGPDPQEAHPLPRLTELIWDQVSGGTSCCRLRR